MRILPSYRISSQASREGIKIVIGPYYASWSWLDDAVKVHSGARGNLKAAVGILMLIRALVSLGVGQTQLEIECIKGIGDLFKIKKVDSTKQIMDELNQLLESSGIEVKWKKCEKTSNVALSSVKATNLILLPAHSALEIPLQSLKPFTLKRYSNDSVIPSYEAEVLAAFGKEPKQQVEALERGNRSAKGTNLSEGAKMLEKVALSASSSRTRIKVEEDLEEVSDAEKDEGVERKIPLSEREKSLKDREDRLKMAEERLKEEKREVKKRKLLLDLEELNKKVEQTQKKLKRLESEA